MAVRLNFWLRLGVAFWAVHTLAAPVSPDAELWRIEPPQVIDPSGLARRLSLGGDPASDFFRFACSPETRLLLNRHTAGEPPAPDADSTELVARAATLWPPPLNRSRAAWRLARLINRTAGGRLIRGQTVLDWRSHLAAWLISSQKSAPEGGGFWAAETADAQIAETAYGVLCFLEL